MRQGWGKSPMEGVVEILLEHRWRRRMYYEAARRGELAKWWIFEYCLIKLRENQNEPTP